MSAMVQQLPALMPEVTAQLLDVVGQRLQVRLKQSPRKILGPDSELGGKSMATELGSTIEARTCIGQDLLWCLDLLLLL